MSEQITLESGEVLDVSAYPLPEGVDDDIVNLNDLGKAMGVSNVTISRWIDAGMPVHQSGGNGRSYAFQLAHCYAWRMWREDAETKARRRRVENAEQLALHFLGVDGEDQDTGPVLSPKEMREYAEAEIKRNQAAEQRGELVRARQVEALLEDVLVAFRNAVSSLPDWMEQEFSLAPGQVDKTQRYCDAILDDTRHKIASAGFRTGQVVAISDRPGKEAGAS